MATFRLSSFADEADMSFARQMEALKALGIGQLEIRGVDGKSFMMLSDDEARNVRAQMDAAGVTLSALGSPIGKIKITDPFEDHLKALDRAIELCGILGTDKIRMFSFFIPEGEDPAIYRDEVMLRMGKMLDVAEAAGIKLYHENEKGIYGDTDERCLDLVKTFPGRLGCVYDPANFIQCGVDMQKGMDLLYDYVDYMHIKDALYADGSVVPPGKGDGQLGYLIERLSAKADGMTLTIEPHLTVFAGLQSLQSEELHHRYTYPDSMSAFTAATEALKEILTERQFTEVEGGFGTWTR